VHGGQSCRNEELGLKRLLTILAILVALLLLLATILLLVLWRASQAVPDFYANALNRDPAEQRAASDAMIQKATLLVSDVQKPDRWETLFTEEELNAWLAVDLKENHPGVLPPEITEPRIVVDPGGLRLACRTRRTPVETVLSVACDVYLAEPGVLAIRVRQVRAGAVPLPLTGILDQIRDLGQRQGFVIQWQQVEGDPVALVRINPVVKGNRPVVIDTLEIAEGEIYVSGTTEEPDN